METPDEQTIRELRLLHTRQESSLLRFFNQTISRGGYDRLKWMLTNPLKSVADILTRQNILRTIARDMDLWDIRVAEYLFEAVEKYLSNNITVITPTRPVVRLQLIRLSFFLKHPEEFQRIQSGVVAFMEILSKTVALSTRIPRHVISDPIEQQLDEIASYVLNFPVNIRNHGKLDLRINQVFEIDYHIRKSHALASRKILDFCYELDAYLAIVKTATSRGMSYPDFVERSLYFKTVDLWHPLLVNPVKCSFSLNENNNTAIISGANGSGKSTFLKSAGIALYLSHLGFPVPASEVKVSFFDRILTAVDLFDDIDRGRSHFYAEILRIKTMVKAQRDGSRCFFLIDELFRSTNFDDAMACSEVVINGLCNSNNSISLISTHVHQILLRYRDIQATSLWCFHTTIEDERLTNTYTMEYGIAMEKVAMTILANEGLLELLSKPS